MTPRIAISGRMGAGKSMLAGLLSAYWDIPVMSFAAGFKSLVEDAGVTKESDEALYRRLCQNIGGGLRQVDTDIWVKMFWDRFATIYDGPASGCVVDDMRYPNEFDSLRDANFCLVRLDVPEKVRAQRRQIINHESETGLDAYASDGQFHIYLQLHGWETPEVVMNLANRHYHTWLHADAGATDAVGIGRKV